VKPWKIAVRGSPEDASSNAWIILTVELHL